MTRIILDISDVQFAAIYGILKNVRLGSRNEYEDAISQLLIDIEGDGAEEWFNDILEDNDLVEPNLRIEASDQDGVIINVE